VIVGAYSEWLWWSHEVRAQVLRLVQEAGGEVWAVDAGLLSDGSAAEDFSAEVRTSADGFLVVRTPKSPGGQSKTPSPVASARSQTFRPVLLSMRTTALSTPGELPIAVSAFELRDGEATIKEVRAFLKERGIDRSCHGVQSMLGNRLYIGEIHFGSLVKRKAHKPAIPGDLFNLVQRKKASRGRRAKSNGCRHADAEQR
jgi:hypothetical protein